MIGHPDAALSRDARSRSTSCSCKLGWVNTFLPLVVPKFLAVDAFFIFLMVQFFRGIPRELDEAAMMDGCGPGASTGGSCCRCRCRCWRRPAIFSFIWTWDDFLGPLIYLNDMRQYTVPLALRAFVDSSGGKSLCGEMFAMSALSLVPVFLRLPAPSRNSSSAASPSAR